MTWCRLYEANEVAEIKTIQIEGLPEKYKSYEGRRLNIFRDISRLDIPSVEGIFRFYPTGRFAEVGVEIWSMTKVES